ncbi:MAG: dimethylsulfonioproprionate lyase family protein [Paracoccaceae bacterium]
MTAPVEAGAHELEAARAALAMPLGLPGSGRVRYGAAMALWRADELTLAELEAYRICSPLDAEDPARLSVRPRPAPPADRDTAIRTAIAAIDLYLGGLPGPGIAEARHGIAAFASGPVAPPPRALRPAPSPLLDPALAALAAPGPDGRPELAAALAEVAAHLDWVTYDLYPRDGIGAAFADGHAFAGLIDPEGPVAAPDFSLGLFLIAPHVFYRDRCHLAPELYAPLTGPHGWRFAPGAPLVTRPAHRPIWNDPNQPHATKVGALPFLAAFAWTRDVLAPSRILPAPDWAAIEAPPS